MQNEREREGERAGEEKANVYKWHGPFVVVVVIIMQKSK